MKKGCLPISAPTWWGSLTDAGLEYVYRMVADGATSVELKTACLLRFNSLTVDCPVEGGAIISDGKGNCEMITNGAVAHALKAFAFLDTPPLSPVRPSHVGKAVAIAADFKGVPFETYLAVDNFFQGFLSTGNDALLDEILKMLYPGSGEVEAWHRTAAVYWLTSLKRYFADRFSELYQQVPADAGNMLGKASPGNIGQKLQQSMDAMLRALTKGDVTKESEILKLDTHRVLTELNAQAEEYRKIKMQYGK